MFELIWLIPALPFAGFLILILVGSRLPRQGVSIIGVGTVGLSAAISISVGLRFILAPPPAGAYTQPLWEWLSVNGFTSLIALYLDPLAVVMILVITVVSFFILLYSSEHMAGEEGFNRFFAYMDLFVGSMLSLVLADNLLLLYLGWEGVGLCSYLLIGFWYRNSANGEAANKAFIVTRIGDTAMAIGLILLIVNLGTLNIQDILSAAPKLLVQESNIVFWSALLILGGAIGKSAQLPLQTWLPDAMAGPAPVSALIHAATMVAAGVYLVARMHLLFTMVPPVQELVAVIGAATLLMASASALTQWDIKRILAYSTISQIGYMFLALGVGAFSAAIFHFMTHAFFKALLFLAAGVVIKSLGDEHDIHKMGGLRRNLPVTFWTFLIGAASLSALPLITAGFYSKDMILSATLTAERGSVWLWAAGIAGAFLTGLYTFRAVFLIFFGKATTGVTEKPGTRGQLSLIVLAVFSLVSGFIQTPAVIAPVSIFTDFLAGTFAPLEQVTVGSTIETLIMFIAMIVPLGGLFAAWWLFLYRPHMADVLAGRPTGALVHRFLQAGWGFDALYNFIFVRPFVQVSQFNRDDFVDLFFRWIALVTSRLSVLATGTQSGLIRRYALGIVVGAIIGVGLILAL
ncbi:MAG: NADH-quinone oxidoreductase subunit L [Syntrophus sp. SKADARSKE-3]|nr:NADH-quinone oxidoreductase subunit L [Syntrophus sp. SKADARSKE-3]